MDAPYTPVFPDGGQLISPYDETSVGAVSGTFGTPASAVWPSANLAIVIPVRVSRRVKLVNAYWLNGSTVSSSYHIDVGVYDFTGCKLGSIGSTAQGSASVIQSVALTTGFGPGLFYIAMACDNAAATFFRSASATLSMCRALGCGQMASAFALPATFAFAASGYAYIPVFGVTSRSFV